MRGTDGNLGEFVAQFLRIGLKCELPLNICNGNGRNCGEWVGPFLERTGPGDRSGNGREKKDPQRPARCPKFLKAAARIVGPDAGAAGNLGGGMGIS